PWRRQLSEWTRVHVRYGPRCGLRPLSTDLRHKRCRARFSSLRRVLQPPVSVAERTPGDVMRIFYFINIVGTDTGISGIPRVVRNLGRSLQAEETVALIPVRWCHRQNAIVHAEQPLLDNIARFHGPVVEESELAGLPIDRGDCDTGHDWLLIAE